MSEIFFVKTGSLKEKSIMLGTGNPLHISLINQAQSAGFPYYNWIKLWNWF
jgi:hypothetical protein